MELDDLKGVWKRQVMPPPAEPDKERFRQIIQRSNRGISRILFWESVLGVAMIVFFGVSTLIFNERMHTYFIKLAIPVIVYAIPVYYRLYRSIRFLRTVDYSEDMRSTLTSFLDYYTKTIRLYVWGGYLAVLSVAVLLFTDAKFISLSILWKTIVLVYLGIAMLAIGPFARRYYGRKAKAIRQYLEDQAPAPEVTSGNP